ncbi:helix-turn-helix transcriptional regulator [Streptomyces sp. SID13666]|uniref:Response regulator transcription factor n=1 Tax=Streptomyces fildesensis TaxID=375757 RepID=A0ABW8C0K0_9ACTN|nr:MULTISPECIES: helix-turn-helix transcriptional regulator [Streptomyces]NEA56948.1 helix-turn-helix transcriptional regulator [Streptomyces sp. SID13666]NEA74862.1 helix-turn-helix transcriptional regulator [Streptomyces sp. SID13588]QNA74718.1 helix-turn-helix transcriptional regulator [Streptomyces sp. So13.3]
MHLLCPVCEVCGTGLRDDPHPHGSAVLAGLRLIPDLTGREHEVLMSLRDGASNRELAEELGITERTVKLHVASLRFKLGGVSRLQLSLIALVHHARGGHARRCTSRPPTTVATQAPPASNTARSARPPGTSAGGTDPAGTRVRPPRAAAARRAGSVRYPSTTAVAPSRKRA